jgi:hypothetical protein
MVRLALPRFAPSICTECDAGSSTFQRRQTTGDVNRGFVIRMRGAIIVFKLSFNPDCAEDLDVSTRKRRPCHHPEA